MIKEFKCLIFPPKKYVQFSGCIIIPLITLVITAVYWPMQMKKLPLAFQTLSCLLRYWLLLSSMQQLFTRAQITISLPGSHPHTTLYREVSLSQKTKLSTVAGSSLNQCLGIGRMSGSTPEFSSLKTTWLRTRRHYCPLGNMGKFHKGKCKKGQQLNVYVNHSYIDYFILTIVMLPHFSEKTTKMKRQFCSLSFNEQKEQCNVLLTWIIK